MQLLVNWQALKLNDNLATLVKMKSFSRVAFATKRSSLDQYYTLLIGLQQLLRCTLQLSVCSRRPKNRLHKSEPLAFEIVINRLFFVLHLYEIHYRYHSCQCGIINYLVLIISTKLELESIKLMVGGLIRFSLFIEHRWETKDISRARVRNLLATIPVHWFPTIFQKGGIRCFWRDRKTS